MNSLPANIYRYAKTSLFYYLLKKLIFLCEQYSETYNLKFNTFNTKHLGVEIVNRNSLVDCNSIMRNIRIKSNTIMKEISYQTTQIKIKLFNSHCMLLFGYVM